MRVLAISDLHSPFQHPHALDFLRDLQREIKPDRVVCLGDEIDAHNFARWPRHPDAIGPVEELAAAKAFLKDLSKLFPAMTIVESNHTYRPWKRAMNVGIPADFLKARQQVLETPRAWRWVDTAEIDGVTYLHGEGFLGVNAARDAAAAYLGSVVIGHIHAHAGISWRRTAGGRYFGMNVGCLIDPSSAAFSYGKHHRNKPVLGTGAVLEGTPFFFPMG